MAYNIRRSRSVDHEPATGALRQRNRVIEIAAWTLGVAVMAGVYWLTRHFLL
jgi:hypothetical protein